MIRLPASPKPAERDLGVPRCNSAACVRGAGAFAAYVDAKPSTTRKKGRKGKGRPGILNGDVGVSLPFHLSGANVVESTARGSISGKLSPKGDLSKILSNAFAEQQRSREERRHLQSAQGYRSGKRSPQRKRYLSAPLVGPKRLEGRRFTSKSLGEQVSVLEALHRRPATAHGTKSSSSSAGAAGAASSSSSCPSSSSGVGAKQQTNIDKDGYDMSWMRNDRTKERGPALVACLEFVESMAQRGFNIAPSGHSNQVLDQALEFIRQSVFSNWLQVCEEQTSNAQLQPMPYHDLALAFEERSDERESEISKLEHVIVQAEEDIKQLREKCTLLSVEKEAAEEAATLIRKSEQKHSLYIQKLRRNLMSSFDDLKAMEEQKDSFRIQAKNRSVELAESERKVAQFEEQSASTEQQTTQLRATVAQLQLALDKEKSRTAALADKVAQLEQLIKM